MPTSAFGRSVPPPPQGGGARPAARGARHASTPRTRAGSRTPKDPRAAGRRGTPTDSTARDTPSAVPPPAVQALSQASHGGVMAHTVENNNNNNNNNNNSSANNNGTDVATTTGTTPAAVPAAPGSITLPAVSGFLTQAQQYRGESVEAFGAALSMPLPSAAAAAAGGGGEPMAAGHLEVSGGEWGARGHRSLSPAEGATTTAVTPTAAAAAAAAAVTATTAEHEIVRPGTVKKLCDEIARLQDALESREEECVAALRNYDALLSDRLTAFRANGEIGFVMEELYDTQRRLKDVQDIGTAHSQVQDELAELKTKLAAATADNALLRDAAATAKAELADTQRVHTRLIESLNGEMRALREGRAAAEAAATAARVEVQQLREDLLATRGQRPPGDAAPHTREVCVGTVEGAVITSEEMGYLLESVRRDLDGQLLTLREALIAQHMDAQVQLKEDTEARLASLTRGVEVQMDQLRRTSAVQREYQHHAGSLHELEEEIERVKEDTLRKEEELKQLKTRYVLVDHKLAVQHRSLSYGEGGAGAAQARNRTPSPTISHHCVVRGVARAGEPVAAAAAAAPTAAGAPPRGASASAGVSSNAQSTLSSYPSLRNALSTGSTGGRGITHAHRDPQQLQRPVSYTSSAAGHTLPTFDPPAAAAAATTTAPPTAFPSAASTAATTRLHGFQGEMQMLLQSLKRGGAGGGAEDESNESLFV